MMKLALAQAELALQAGEVPVGCVFVLREEEGNACESGTGSTSSKAAGCGEASTRGDISGNEKASSGLVGGGEASTRGDVPGNGTASTCDGVVGTGTASTCDDAGSGKENPLGEVPGDGTASIDPHDHALPRAGESSSSPHPPHLPRSPRPPARPRGRVIGAGFNRTNVEFNGTRHAELVATDEILLRSEGR